VFAIHPPNGVAQIPGDAPQPRRDVFALGRGRADPVAAPNTQRELMTGIAGSGPGGICVAVTRGVSIQQSTFACLLHRTIAGGDRSPGSGWNDRLAPAMTLIALIFLPALNYFKHENVPTSL